MITVTILEAQKRLPELLAAAEAGEPVEIRADTGQSFQLTPRPAQSTPRPAPAFINPNWPGYPAAGCCEGMFVVPDDFKEPLEELREYME